jgi:hypothetical protein
MNIYAGSRSLPEEPFEVRNEIDKLIGPTATAGTLCRQKVLIGMLGKIDLLRGQSWRVSPDKWLEELDKIEDQLKGM